jgi:hypothetical protein
MMTAERENDAKLLTLQLYDFQRPVGIMECTIHISVHKKLILQTWSSGSPASERTLIKEHSSSRCLFLLEELHDTFARYEIRIYWKEQQLRER